MTSHRSIMESIVMEASSERAQNSAPGQPSVFMPTPISTLIVAVSLTWSTIPERVCFWNPWSSTVIVYEPGRRNGTL